MKDTVLTALGQSHLLRRGQHPWASHRWVVMALKFKLHSSFEWLYSIPADDLLNWKLKLFFLFVLLFFLHFFLLTRTFIQESVPTWKSQPQRFLALLALPSGHQVLPVPCCRVVWCARHPCASQLLPPAIAPGQSWASPCWSKRCHQFTEDRPRMVQLGRKPNLSSLLLPSSSEGSNPIISIGIERRK